MPDSDSDDDITIKTFINQLDILEDCNRLMVDHGSSLQKAITDHVVEPSKSGTKSSKYWKNSGEKNLRLINEKAQTLHRSSDMMINACADFVELAKSYEKKFTRLLEDERCKCALLEETVEQLAKQHIRLERACTIEMEKERNTGNSVVQNIESPSGSIGNRGSIIQDEYDEDLFEDALSDFEDIDIDVEKRERGESLLRNNSPDPAAKPEPDFKFTNSPQAVAVKESGHRRWASEDIKTLPALEAAKKSGGHRRWASEDYGIEVVPTKDGLPECKIYRDRIPDRPDANINLWSIMKNCIGKELTKIAMPVNFNEPLSMTQRLTEELEYSYLLDTAANCENSLEQICHIAAFSVSGYASTALRVNKPFNPLLGETFEFDRSDDLGWYSLAEQVSHHPPSLAHHAEGRGWTLWQNFTMTSKFRGKYLKVIPLGTAHCTFSRSGNHYTWQKVTTTVNNIIVGRLWIDQSGEMDIINHTTGEKCHLIYHPYSYFSFDEHKRISGYVTDKDNITRYVLSGTWDQKVEWAEVNYEEGESLKKHGKQSPSELENLQTLPPKLLWNRNQILPVAKQIYYFTPFTCSLNQIDHKVSPTDSRLRPDIRKMEEQDFDEANKVKLELEERQRSRRREREAQEKAANDAGRHFEGYKPIWFEYTEDEYSDTGIYMYKGGYWESKEKQDWTTCPSIYLDSPA